MPARHRRSPSARTAVRRGRAVALAVVLALVAGGCAAAQGVRTLDAAPSPSEAAPTTEPTTGTADTSDTSDTSAGDTTGTAGSSDTTTTTPPSTAPPSDGPELLVDIPLADVVSYDPGKPERSYDAFLAVALSDVERWWSEVFPQVYGQAFQPLQGGVYAGYPERQSALPGCGEPTTAYQDLELYVAFYCQFDDFMIYDDGPDSLLAPLVDEFGPAVMGVVLAHEYGHAIQQRIGALDQALATIFTEQQADCFAGAWVGQAYRGESPMLRLGDADVRAALIAMLEVRDPVGTDQFVSGGHGSAFDRVGAFQEGFLNGPGRCAELLDNPLTLMPNQFQTPGDYVRGGNASYDCRDDSSPDCTPATQFLADDLNDFWTTALGDRFTPLTAVPTGDLDGVACDGGGVRLTPQVLLCSADGTVSFDEPAVRGLYEQFGDFTLGYLYGIAWAEHAQSALGSPLAGEDRALLDDCFTGAWVRDITPDAQGNTPRQHDTDGDGQPDTGISSSPGDLDEAIRMVIIEGDPTAGTNLFGSPFEKIESFRTGVLGGLDACEARLP